MSHSSDPLIILRERFGYEEFRPGQEEVIERLLAGRGAAAIFPTGSGKSICYQLPSLLLPGLTLVISPLLALMKDQIDSLRSKGVQAERLDSSLDEEDYRRVTADIRKARVKLLFVAPERLGNERFLNLIQGQQISLLAVDEAHCISSWGHNFRPDYLKLADAARSLGVERVLALTATATPQVSADMAAAFGIATEDIINTGFYRSNLELRVVACADSERPKRLVQRIKERPRGPTIVYVSLQRHAEEVADILVQNGCNAAAYHAGMAAEKRSATQEAFMRDDIEIICATIAFGMGIDKANIRYIYHYHLAKGFESYMQEIGRAGRDGQRSICELFACADDATTLENFVFGDTPDEISLNRLLNELLTQGESIDLAISDLARRFDMRPLVISTLLTRLELAGVIRSEGHYYGSIRFAPKASSKILLEHYSEAQGAFLRKVFSCCSKAKKWVTLDVDRAIAVTGQDRAVILRALESLQSNGLAELQLAGYRQRYRLLDPEADLQLLAENLGQRFRDHERMEIERIERMLDYAEETDCLTARLLDYFGEKIAPCGHCGICLGEAPAELTPRSSPRMETMNVEGFADLVARHPDALGSPRQQARFLCGLSSPAVSGVRGLRGNPLFGCCSEVPFETVLESRE
tara:strand:- start:14018 stop:15934 length:1917 start_codon:yes stop_codon:yes gene_type:complete